ncbi:acetyl-CoA acetyltransferase [Platysternon megacephalum]|uniref:Acetyl-CoA acetyltransferase n=1 Tax=Platysternon megacephalum TaxID=55544 RepID=A0A4D9DIM3_9SAUR|nr:acetyl-CoA acetyltransferase [Platysternon megacephalum]
MDEEEGGDEDPDAPPAPDAPLRLTSASSTSASHRWPQPPPTSAGSRGSGIGRAGGNEGGKGLTHNNRPAERARQGAGGERHSGTPAAGRPAQRPREQAAAPAPALPGCGGGRRFIVRGALPLAAPPGRRRGGRRQGPRQRGSFDSSSCCVCRGQSPAGPRSLPGRAGSRKFTWGKEDGGEARGLRLARDPGAAAAAALVCNPRQCDT